MPKRAGRKSKAQTPAPRKERIYGSKKNPKGSAASEKSASKIKLDEKTMTALKNKLKEFKEKHPNKKNITLNDLKAVYRRGAGAYSKSHRPTITGGAPNSRNAWSMARVNKFLLKAGGTKVKAAYVQDDDLMKMKDGGTTLLAPNGKPSNLTPEQYKLVRTKAFKDWFGDWEKDPENASKVVDENGEPMVVYHGTKTRGEQGIFSIFNLEKSGESNKIAKVGFWFTPIKKFAENFGYDSYWGKNAVFIYYVFLNLKNPKIYISDDSIYGDSYEKLKSDIYAIEGQSQERANVGGIGYALKDEKQTIDNFREKLLEEGFDGIMIKNTRYDRRQAGGNNDQYVALFSNNIKLADGSNTTFDSDSDDIRYAKGGEIEKYYRAEVGDKYEKQKVETPKGFYEKVGDDGYPVIRYDEYLISNVPEIAASKNIYGAILGAASMMKFDKGIKENTPIQIYSIEEKPDIDISHWGGADFEYLSEVRYRKNVVLKHLFEYRLSGEVYRLIKDFYDFKEFEDLIKYDDQLEFDDRLDYIYEMIENDTFLKKLKSLIDKTIGNKSFAKGGDVDEVITCKNCGWSWNESQTTPSEKYVCHKCGFDNEAHDDYAKGGQTFNDKELLAKWKRGESIGFTATAHLKAKGLIPRSDGEKRKSPQYKRKGGLIGGFEDLEDEWLSKKIEIFLDKVKPIKFYFVDPNTNTLTVGFDKYYSQDAAQKVYEEATSSKEFFHAPSVESTYDSKTGDLIFKIKLKKPVEYSKGGNIVYSAIFFDEDEIVKRYGQVHPNLYSHHSTIEFKPQSITNLPIGDRVKISIVGRLTTDKVDVLLVNNPFSKNKHPHITLSTSEGVKPFESNKEIEQNIDKVEPLNDYLEGVVGYFDGSGDITKYAKGGEVDEKVIKERWAKKKDSLMNMADNIRSLRTNLRKDLKGDDDKDRLTALAISLMDKTAERVGNNESEANGHLGITGLSKRNVKVEGNTITLKYIGKSGVKQEKQFSDEGIASALKDAIANSQSKYVFETSDGFRIKNDRINRYLGEYDISAKDLRGYSANQWIVSKLREVKDKEILGDEAKRKKKFNEIVKSVAEKVGHGAPTLKKHYMLPSLEREWVNNGKIVDLANIKRAFKRGGDVGVADINQGANVVNNIDYDPLDETQDIPNDGEGVFKNGGELKRLSPGYYKGTYKGVDFTISRQGELPNGDKPMWYFQINNGAVHDLFHTIQETLEAVKYLIDNPSEFVDGGKIDFGEAKRLYSIAYGGYDGERLSQSQKRSQSMKSHYAQRKLKKLIGFDIGDLPSHTNEQKKIREQILNYSEMKKGGELKFNDVVLFHEEQGNWLVPKNTIYAWLYDDPKASEKIESGEYDYILFPPGGGIGLFSQKGYVPPLLKVWTKKYQAQKKGANKLIGIVRGWYDEDNKKLYIDMMTTRKDMRRKGVNSYIIKEIREYFGLEKEQVEFVDTTKEGKMFSKSDKYDDGGEVDLFEHYDELPKKVQAILEKYENEEPDYTTLESLQGELEEQGYTFDYGLDYEPYGLRKMEKGGELVSYPKRIVEFFDRENKKWIREPFTIKKGQLIIYNHSDGGDVEAKFLGKSGDKAKIEILDSYSPWTRRVEIRGYVNPAGRTEPDYYLNEVPRGTKKTVSVNLIEIADDKYYSYWQKPISQWLRSPEFKEAFGHLDNPTTMAKGGEISDEDKKETYKKWKSLVNMSKSELEKFYNSEEGKVAGLTASQAKSQGIDSGRESARWIMKMKDTSVKNWTPTMWKWAKKQISFISRMSGNKGKLYDESGAKTRKHTSLLIWGHNPTKKAGGGELDIPIKENAMNEVTYNQLPAINDLGVGKKFVLKEHYYNNHNGKPTHQGCRYLIVENMGDAQMSDCLKLKVHHCYGGGGVTTMGIITRPIKNIMNKGRDMGESLSSGVEKAFKRGGELDPDKKEVKQYFEHKSGAAGGLLVGKRHSEGGIQAINKSTGQPLEMEGGEVVITRDAVSDSTLHDFNGKQMTNREILSAINESGGGVKFAEGGDVSCLCSGKEYKLGGKTYKDYELFKKINNSYGSKSAIEKGMKVEDKEHGETFKMLKNGEITYEQFLKKLVVDHLSENPKYYDK